jgi:hypothetical protein
MNKTIVPVSLIGIVLGYTSFTITSSDHTNGKNKFDLWFEKTTGFYINTSLKFEINPELNLHIHHWLVLLSLLLLLGDKYPLISGFCIGGIIQSFVTYDDCFEVIS